ncbi:MAG TPA: host specificity factor TipJ family phage tail protein [Rhizomicrobium sp.]|nr:host specificity factor TipJ family phage tail protein [Rhizomicrobium sp.]
MAGARVGAMLVHVINPMVPQLGLRRFGHCAGMTVLEAIEEAGWQLPSTTVLIRDGELVHRAAWDITPIGREELVLLVTLPQNGKGGGASQIFAIVASIALALFAPQLGVLLLGDELAATTIAGVTLGQIATVGILLAGTTLITALLPKPKAALGSPSSFDGQPTSPTYSLSAQSNVARLFQPIPERFGTFKFKPDLSAQAYFDFVDSAQELKEEFCLGIGEFEIHEVGISNNPIWQDGDYTGTYPEMELQFLAPSDSNTLFSNNVVTSADVSNVQLLGTNEVGYGWLGPFILNPAGTAALQVSVDFSAPGGLFMLDSTGNLKPATASFQVQVQQISDLGAPIGGWTTVIDESVTATTRDAIRATYSADLTPARYQVRFERTNAKATDVNTADQIGILAMRGYLPQAAAAPDTTRIALKARSTKNLNGDSAQQFYVIATRKLPIWDAETETWSAPTATRSIAWAAAYICRAANGLRKADNQVDLAKLADLDAIWTARDDYFDGTFETGDSAWTNLQAVLRVGRAEPLRVGRYVTFNRDEPKSAYAGGFSPANILPGSFSIDYLTFDANSVDGLWVSFIDSRNWQPNKVWCALPDSTMNPDDAPTIDLSLGITDRDHAWREGMFLCATNRYRRRFPSFRTELEGRTCFRGSKVLVSHWMPVWGASALALYLEVHFTGDIVTLSEPWNSANVLDDASKILTLMTPDGHPYGPVTVELLDDGEETGKCVLRLISTAAVTEGKYAGQQPRDWPVWDGGGLEFERPRALYGTATQKPVDALVVSMTPDSGYTATIVTVLDDQRVHFADGTIPPIAGDTPVPPDEGSTPTSRANDDLEITGILLTQIDQAGGVLQPSFIGVTIQGAPDASKFDAQWKWNGADSFQPMVTGLNRTFQVPAIAGVITVQARAEGFSGFGDWFEASLSSTGVPFSPLAPATTGTVTTTDVFAAGSHIGGWDWDLQDGAIQYQVVVFYKASAGDTFHAGDVVWVDTNAFTIASSYKYDGVHAPYALKIGMSPYYDTGLGDTIYSS